MRTGSKIVMGLAGTLMAATPVIATAASAPHAVRSVAGAISKGGQTSDDSNRTDGDTAAAAGGIGTEGYVIGGVALLALIGGGIALASNNDSSPRSP